MSEEEVVEIISQTVLSIRKGGPDRILNHEGIALSTPRAMEAGIRPTVIFIRKDGWSLAADKNMEYEAYSMYEDEWVAFMIAPSPVAFLIKNYNPPEVIYK